MRHAARRMLGVCLVVGCCSHNVRAEESKSRWWPFGGDDKVQAAEPTTTAPVVPPPIVASTPSQGSTEAELPDVGPVKDRPWMIESPLAKVSWPELRMPKMAIPKPQMPRPSFWSADSQAEDKKNSWVEKAPDPASPSPLQSVKNGAHTVTEGTKTAWRKTVNAITPGDESAGKTESNPRMAHRDPAAKPSMWDRITGKEEPKPEGPRTISEWMSQDRVE